jgi:hypothetical protein
MDLSVVAFINLLRAAINIDLMAQQNICSAFSNRHCPFWAKYHLRENSTSSYLCSCTGPLATLARANAKIFGRDELALGGQRQLWPPLHTGRRVFIG